MHSPLIFIHVFLLIHWTHPSQSNAISFSPTWKMEMEEGQYPHLFNNKLLLRAVCSGHSHRRKSRCTHTHWAPFSTFCWHKPKAAQLARSKISFQGRNGTPQRHKTASGDSFWGWRMPRQQLLWWPSRVILSNTFHSPLWKSGWVRALPPTFSRL